MLLKDFYRHHARQHRCWLFKETMFWMWAASQNQPCPTFSTTQLLLCAFQSSTACLSLHDQGLLLLTYFRELLLLRTLSFWASFLSSLTHSVMLHSSVCYSTDVSVVMIHDVTSTGMCIIKLIPTEEQRRVGTPLPFELHVGLTQLPQKLLLGSGLFYLGCKEQIFTLACLWFISTIRLLIRC